MAIDLEVTSEEEVDRGELELAWKRAVMLYESRAKESR